ncbi:MAG: T9SS type A sorting domain-containing protein [Saprospiraceae bacterium]|nr:T9SS type A sorting domain-containing protein [Saprospiraceae bacterium]
MSFPGVMHHISGHRDGCAPGYTTCPGQALYNLLPGLRNDTETYIASECLSSQVDVLPHHFTYSFTPNPVSDAISLKQNSVFSTIHFSIIDPYGRLVEKFTTLPNETEKTVLLDKLAPGLYFIKSSSQFSDLPLRLLKI